jgi:cytochrome c553
VRGPRRYAKFALLLVLGIGPSLHAQNPREKTEAERLATEVCAACHGVRGESRLSPAFPRLAGQQADYLDAQLKAFRDRSRGDPMAEAFMWGMASQLSDDQIAQLAAYFSAQKPVAGTGHDRKLLQAGEAIFTKGLPAEHVAACMTCHGPHAEGASVVPRLAGQHAEYLVKQLSLFKTEARADASAPIMHATVVGLTFDQMEAVAAYESSR